MEKIPSETQEEESCNKHLLLQNLVIASFSHLNADLALLEVPLRSDKCQYKISGHS